VSTGNRFVVSTETSPFKNRYRIKRSFGVPDHIGRYDELGRNERKRVRDTRIPITTPGVTYRR
jgi:hypothetical protein